MTTLPLTLPTREPRSTAHRWLCGALRAAILDRRLRPGARVPATRDLARQYGLSRGTVVTAFDQLRAEGYLTGRAGSGTFVNPQLPPPPSRPVSPAGPSAQTAPRTRPAPSGAGPRPFSAHAERVRGIAVGLPGRARAFRPFQPAVDLFPIATWARVSAQRLRRATRGMLLGCPAEGYAPLRDAIADYLTTSRGVRCDAAQVVVVAGAMEGLDLACRLLLDAGARVCMEDPGYLGASRVFDAWGARVRPLPVDAEGMVLPGVGARHARLVYVTPAHQFPTGVAMSASRRLALLDWARASGAIVFEDDYDSEYRYSSQPIPALQGLDVHGVVMYCGTFSKVLFPSLRLAYLVVPRDLVDRLVAIRSLGYRHVPLLDQAVLCDFMVDGHFGRHIRRMREVYAERLSALIDASRRTLAGLLDVSAIEAGLQTSGWLPPGMTGGAAARAATDAGLEVSSLGSLWRRPIQREGLLLGFAAVDPREIRRGVTTLARALESVARAGRRSPSRGPR